MTYQLGLPEDRRLEWQAELRLRHQWKQDNDQRIAELEAILETPLWPARVGGVGHG